MLDGIGDIEFGVMHADDFEAVFMVALVPLLIFREGAYAVDAGVLPKIDQHYLSGQPSHGQRLRIDPGGRGRDTWTRHFCPVGRTRPAPSRWEPGPGNIRGRRGQFGQRKFGRLEMQDIELLCRYQPGGHQAEKNQNSSDQTGDKSPA